MFLATSVDVFIVCFANVALGAFANSALWGRGGDTGSVCAGCLVCRRNFEKGNRAQKQGRHDPGGAAFVVSDITGDPIPGIAARAVPFVLCMFVVVLMSAHILAVSTPSLPDIYK